MGDNGTYAAVVEGMFDTSIPGRNVCIQGTIIIIFNYVSVLIDKCCIF